MHYICEECKAPCYIDDNFYMSLQKEPSLCARCVHKSPKIDIWLQAAQSYTWDPVVDKVIQQLIDRSKLWQKKYNTTLENNNLWLKQWLQHILEELMDACNYIQKTIDLL